MTRSVVRIQQCRNSQGINEGYIAFFDDNEIANIAYGQNGGFVIQIISTQEIIHAKTMRNAKQILAQKFDKNFREFDHSNRFSFAKDRQNSTNSQNYPSANNTEINSNENVSSSPKVVRHSRE